eukprot:CAMPEP_0202866010 /NCGR_PEP_ID=MMETSP1391-20130828/7004_1 /ASSEMBLY_ACC=CAM_ASM_000867 /TAXON_ID=1034604 /ORGANISM="Chlamydomonas leiostraca, Strain SAG 11-49" /LENGTH=119 /DNA_ID=CAMNT_0049545915 /DNA_START=27 /DNA_END=386 /DNA_ORIENTATION=+
MLSARTFARAPVANSARFQPRIAPRLVKMGSTQSGASTEAFDASTKINFTLDASQNGCTGMYWRSKPDMNASVSAPDWPRNGAKLQGWKSVAHPGWVKVDHPQGYWLPIEQHGKPVVHF